MRLSKKSALRLAIGVLVLFFVLSLTIFDSGNKLSDPTPSAAIDDHIVNTNRSQIDLANPENNNSVKDNPSLIPGKQNESTELTDFHRLETKDGKKLWEVKGKIAIYQEPSKLKTTDTKQPEIKLKDPIFTSYQDNQPAYEIRSLQAGIIMGITGIEQVTLREQVKLLMQSKYQLEATEAQFKGSSQDVTIPVPVKISGEGFEINGNRLDGNLKTQTFTLSGKVTTLISGKIVKEKK